jgi:hypothetical protein
MSSGSVCITSTKPSVQTPVTPKKKKKYTCIHEDLVRDDWSLTELFCPILIKKMTDGGLQWLTLINLATWLVQGQPEQIVPETSISKISRAKWTAGVAQAVECLLCKCKALSSNLSLINK